MIIQLLGVQTTKQKSFLAQGAGEGTVVRAESQTAGRGRRGRRWISEPGNLFCSVILCPKCPLTTASQLSFVIALAVGRTILPYLTNPEILSYKWPNDLLLQEEKVAGILIETESAGGQLAEACVIGIGVNLTAIPEHSAYPVTALKYHTTTNLNRDILFSQLLDQIKNVYQIWQDEGFTPIREAWMERAHRLWENLTVNFGENDHLGQFIGLSEEGAFLLKEENGTVHRLVSIEI